MDSSASTMTLQGKAIKRASIDFGDGKTLPFAPCKRGYAPVVEVAAGVESNHKTIPTKNKTKNSNSGNTTPNSCATIDGYDNDNERTTTQKEFKFMVACSFHEKARRKRLARDKGKIRGGEADPAALFWSKVVEKETAQKHSSGPEKGATSIVAVVNMDNSTKATAATTTAAHNDDGNNNS